MNKLKGLILLFSFVTTSLLAQEDYRINKTLIGGITTDIFSQPYKRIFNTYTMGIGFKNPKITLNVLYNIGQIFEYDISDEPFFTAFENQYEIDFYHQPTKTTSYWLNYAYSDCPHFPTHRAMGRVWQNLGSGFLASGGVKYYYFDDNLFTLTSGLEKYIDRFWVEGKTFIYLKEPDTKLAFQLNSRVFWKDINYAQLTLMTGSAQDEPWRTPDILTAHTIRLSVVTFLNEKLQLRANMGYSYEEYSQDLWRSRYSGGVSMTYYMF